MISFVVTKLRSMRVATRLSLLLIAGLFGLQIALPIVTAQQAPQAGFNLTVSPLPLAVETKPGVPVTSEIRIKNENLQTERVKISLMKFGAEGEDGTPKLEELDEGDDFADWISFSEKAFTAEPNVWKPIKMTISPPKDAAFGYYYAVVFSRENAENQIEEGQSNLLGAVASLVLLDVQAPGAARDIKLLEYSMPNRSYEFLPAEFDLRVENTGNTHAAPRGNIFIKRGSKTVGILEVNKERGYVLPGSTRKFSAIWDDGSPVYKVVTADGKVELDENNKQKSRLDWGSFNPSKLRIGKYTAQLTLVYNDGNSDIPVEGDISFWVIPWRILGVVGLVLLFILAGLYAMIIRPIRNRIKKSNV